MNLCKRLLVILLLGITSTIFGQSNCGTNQCENSCCSDWDFSVFANYLYWHVCPTQVTPVSHLDDNIVLTRELTSKYESGYRVGGTVGISCWEIGVEYTSIDSSHHFANPLDSFAGEFTFDYSVVDIAIGRSMLFWNNCLALKPFIGAKLAWIDETKNAVDDVGTASFDSGHVKSKFSGYGLIFGAEIDWQLWRTCFPTSFVAKTSYSILDGSFSPSSDGWIISDSSRNPDFDSGCEFVYVTMLYAGLDFELIDCNCGSAHLRIGYETQYWGNMKLLNQHLTFQNWIVGSLGYGGLVLGLDFNF